MTDHNPNAISISIDGDPRDVEGLEPRILLVLALAQAEALRELSKRLTERDAQLVELSEIIADMTEAQAETRQ
jgi:Tfp pilus assembly PilM family ATPase